MSFVWILQERERTSLPNFSAFALATPFGLAFDERERVFAKDRDPARERKQAFQFIERALQSRVAAVFEVRRAQICYRRATL